MTLYVAGIAKLYVYLTLLSFSQRLKTNSPSLFTLHAGRGFRRPPLRWPAKLQKVNKQNCVFTFSEGIVRKYIAY